ncbi:MAG: fumarylacetoacetate hydrolase family protein [Candidatus Cloacimonetes bacterium]|nr:fumarylacetoacetate hydrolase family protein [Candidatus Cloacimonadota bacterium]MCF7813602.1 fumarylacetoacetate hydrolase family protein [Candidatus Cloacimonadota bacterium]MCF7867918.1 fumarylacetoacetate hydrolase family protein [Candidatus Cloacimonadota bacterium]MCF7882889.1 fumarylacetoacetate hydrolase family protein [Candidatus Cloacimonadota bacterium]
MKTVKFGKRNITPSKIVCVGRNYVEHIKELSNEIPENMVLFIKPNTSIADQLVSYVWEPIHYEGEICFLIENDEFVAVAFGLDLTKRGLQSKLKGKGLPWERAKAFDGAALFSEFVPIDEIKSNLTVELDVNGETMQSGNVLQMIYKPDQILEEIQSFITLNDGDIVMTGTPNGVGVVEKRGVYEGRILKGKELLVSAKWKAL